MAQSQLAAPERPHLWSGTQSLEWNSTLVEMRWCDERLTMPLVANGWVTVAACLSRDADRADAAHVVLGDRDWLSVLLARRTE
jgi:hypothetical protein